MGKKATPGLCFLDIINYLGPGTSYEKWIKVYGCKQTKSWLPYEWFDNPEKLNYPGLPDYPEWYSKQKKGYLLSQEEWQVFRNKGMQTFADWLRYYNNLYVAPFLTALREMKTFYEERGVDIIKDSVSLPGVSLQYLIRGTQPELFSPGKAAYNKLKAAVVGGVTLLLPVTSRHTWTRQSMLSVLTSTCY